ncbi:MAG: hypothetical protein JSS38_01515 [Nitrospira sp.]|nr:hypothetical protein [Nitrospira sp.]
MSETKRGLFQFFCEVCAKRSPVAVASGFRWRCDHRKVTLMECGDRRSLQYDEQSIRPDTRPAVIDNKNGPFFVRW